MTIEYFVDCIEFEHNMYYTIYVFDSKNEKLLDWQVIKSDETGDISNTDIIIKYHLRHIIDLAYDINYRKIRFIIKEDE